MQAQNKQYKSEIASHQAQLEALKQQDPEFYEYLQQTDQELLKFGQDDDEDEEAEEEEEEGVANLSDGEQASVCDASCTGCDKELCCKGAVPALAIRILFWSQIVNCSRGLPTRHGDQHALA